MRESTEMVKAQRRIYWGYSSANFNSPKRRLLTHRNKQASFPNGTENSAKELVSLPVFSWVIRN